MARRSRHAVEERKHKFGEAQGGKQGDVSEGRLAPSQVGFLVQLWVLGAELVESLANDPELKAHIVHRSDAVVSVPSETSPARPVQAALNWSDVAVVQPRD
eukprot:CAMPEP_0182466364 /NCGR_PEP_ID=MMETSP1319-20130603/11890_2 /TAXON_ID=172717 /ORGANISM="Bolidomonas pacifica, Strain RCC208" /LENGTH=100 /DNA_ID=CAMNT_0024666347 /DNA_START=118 /DNA_END=421 /DNA_ORIENTATION=-